MYDLVYMFLIFVCKQKTAYEMRISDWSSDVCSSDLYVVERMREGGYNVGGEQSGHIVLSDFATTGDVLIAALQVLAVVVQAGQPASEVTRLFDQMPQALRNVRLHCGAPLEGAGVQAAMRGGEMRLGTAGRRGVRYDD